PIYEVRPAGPWNYGLVLDGKAADAFQVVRGDWPKDGQPFRADGCPLELATWAKRIPNWRLDHRRMPGRLQPSPAKSDGPAERIRLVPMGAARLRISVLPVIGTGPDAHEWTAPPAPAQGEVTASWCNPGDSEEAVMDGLVPRSSADSSIPRF